MDIETVKVCPLGSKCREIKDNKIYECAWFVKLAGTNPQTGEEIDEWGCAMAWTPILLVENANTNRGQTAAIESFRNETVQQAMTTNNILLAAATQRKELSHDGNHFI
ncbi:hypothetical protein [Methylobacter sp. YRD-M1]|uniref:hypothetical protein n=1 Tax=Methylobacter sp. YRD-M1 TaxID=2911520 RepID=UPI00227C5993|nr:hypothetical protein [Methylobacter sp. YRD-M1]WAK01871.1 hypothetical protein LZ558_18960 [Methylobacter sp. YRD-M1]